jgi:hypothetical protein
VNVLLIYPHWPETYWSFRHALKLQGSRAKFPDRMPRQGNMSRFGRIVYHFRKPSIVSWVSAKTLLLGT